MCHDSSWTLTIRKLDEERGEEVATVLFIKVPEIKIKVHHQG